MRIHSILLIILFILFSCEDNTETVIKKFPNGKVKSETVYKLSDSLKVKLKMTEYYENGNEKIEGKFKNGKRHGTWTYWYENGNLWSKGDYEEGKRNGASVVYYSDGDIRYEGQYTNNKKTGTWSFYDEKGALLKEEDFDEK